MNTAPLTWGTLLKKADGVQSDLLHWWLSDFTDAALTRLPLEQMPSQTEQETFAAAVERLRKGEPIQYVCGRAPFRHLDLLVTHDVLIPRPETEQLVQWALDLDLPPESRILDVGIGSGCIALSLKQERPDLQVKGIDISSAALNVARQNAERLSLEVEFQQADLLQQEPALDRDLLIANLPYIGETERPDLPETVRDWEPGIALFSGTTGTDTIEHLLLQAPRVLTPKGRVLLETGETHTPFLTSFAEQHGWALTSKRDLAGRERFHLLRQKKTPE